MICLSNEKEDFTSNHTNYRNFLEANYKASALLLGMEAEKDIASALMESMALVGGTLIVDRVQIWRNIMVDGCLSFSLAHEWLSEAGREKTPVPAGFSYPYNKKSEWEQLFLGGGYINGPLASMSEEDKAFLGTYDIQSVVIMPLFLDSAFWGFFSVDDCICERTFTDDEISFLKSVSLMMASAVHHEAQTATALEAGERFKAMLDAMPLTCHIWDRNFNLFECNEANLHFFGLESDEEFYSRFFDLSPEYQPDGKASKEKAVEILTQAFETGESLIEWMHITTSGEPLPCKVTLKRLRFGDEDVLVSYIMDLREHKRMMAELEEALQEAEQANDTKSAFLARMSHEMRTPLNAVIGLSELCLFSKLPESEILENLKKIHNAGSTLLSIVNDILDISKIEAGKLEMIPVVYELPSVINDTVMQNVLSIGEKPIELRLEIDEDLFSQLHGDELRVKQVMNNLLSNAIKYTREGTVTLRIKNELTGDGEVWLHITVADTGIGIKEEDVGKLFENYTQVDQRTNRMIEGTGLGLAIMKNIVELMGGSVAVESVYGKGSVFTIRIRQGFVSDATIGASTVESLCQFHYNDNKRSSGASLTRIQLPYARVLLVDDLRVNLDVACGMMKPYGMQIDCVTSGRQAIEAIAQEKVKYSAIFMDHMMPEMDGVEATRIIREEIGTEYARSVPIIMLTANAIVGNEEVFLACGFQAFLSKPIDIARLDSVIKKWVRDKEQEKLYAASPATQVDSVGTQTEASSLSAWQIDGLDLDGAVRKFGDRETVIHILETFAEDTPNLIEQIRQVTPDTLKDYTITVHGIKGSCMGIFATDLGADAMKLEEAARAGRFDYIETHNGDFADKIETLVNALKQRLDSETVKERKTMPEQRLLSELMEASARFDIDGVDRAMSELTRYTYDTNQELIQWLSKTVKVMGFKQINQRLSDLVGG